MPTRIYYTTDGSEPDDQSALYTGPIQITVPTTVKAVAYRDGKKGAVAEESFIIKPPAPAISPEGGEFAVQTTVTIESAADDEIRYTVDGSDPDLDSAVYSEPLVLTETTTVKAAAARAGQLSAVVSEQYDLVELPSELTVTENLVAHYKAYEGVTEGSPGRAVALADQSGNNRHAAINDAQTNGWEIIENGLNGRNTLGHPDGGNARLMVPIGAISQGTIYFILKIHSALNGRYVFDGRPGGSFDDRLSITSNGSNPFTVAGCEYPGLNAWFRFTITVEPQKISRYVDDDEPVVSLHESATKYISGSGGNSSIAAGYTGANSLDMEFAEILFYSEVHDANKQMLVNAYLKHITGEMQG